MVTPCAHCQGSFIRRRLRADALRETEQPAAADAAYRKLLNTSEAAAAWHGLGLLAGRRGDYAVAVNAFHEAARREPTNAVMLGDLGYAQLRAGEIAAARVSIAQAAELAPDNRKILGNLALFLLVSGEKSKAEAVMEQAKLPIESRSTAYRLAEEMKKCTVGIDCVGASNADAHVALRSSTADNFAVSLRRALPEVSSASQ